MDWADDDDRDDDDDAADEADEAFPAARDSTFASLAADASIDDEEVSECRGDNKLPPLTVLRIALRGEMIAEECGKSLSSGDDSSEPASAECA